MGYENGTNSHAQNPEKERLGRRVSLEQLEAGSRNEKGAKNISSPEVRGQRSDENLKWMTKSGRLSAMPRSLSQQARFSHSRPIVQHRSVVPQRTDSTPGAYAVVYVDGEYSESAPIPPTQDSIMAKVVEEYSVYTAEAEVVQQENKDKEQKSRRQRLIMIFLVMMVVKLIVLVAVLIPRARKSNHHIVTTQDSRAPTQNSTTPEPTSWPTPPSPSETPLQALSTLKPSLAPTSSKPSLAPSRDNPVKTSLPPYGSVLPQSPSRDSFPTSSDSLDIFSSLQGSPWNLVGNSGILGIDPEIRFGASVSVNGDGSILAIAAPLAGPNMEGSIQVFEKRKRWRALGDPIMGQYFEGNLGSSLSISRDGRSLVAGAPFAENYLGIAQAYSFNGVSWKETGQVLMGSEVTAMNGDAVAMSGNGNVIAVASSFSLRDVNDPTTVATGRVQVYTYNDARNLWIQKGQDLVGEKAFDHFGCAVALTRNGRRVAIGAPQAGTDSEGEVSVFDLDLIENEWLPVANTIKGIHNGTNFGSSIALSLEGQRLIAGGHRFDKGRGLARVYQLEETSWSQVGQDLVGSSEGDRAGWSVSMNGDGSLVAVAMNPEKATTTTTTTTITNRAYGNTQGAMVLRDFGKSWERTSQVFGTGDAGAYNVAMASDRSVVAVGLPSGVVRVFSP